MKVTFPLNYLFIAVAVLPLLFWLIDVRWKMALLKCSDRQKEISEFLNSEAFYESFKNNLISPTSLALLDPTGERTQSKGKSYFFHAIRYKDNFIFYPVQILCSLLLFFLI